MEPPETVDYGKIVESRLRGLVWQCAAVRQCVSVSFIIIHKIIINEIIIYIINDKTIFYELIVSFSCAAIY
jgi:hypothetical protein